MALQPSTSRSSKYLESYETPGYSSGAKAGSAGTGKEDTWAYGSPGDVRKANFSGGGRSRGSSGPVGSTTRTKTVRKGDAPEMPDLPTFKAPEVNKRAIRAMTQKLAAPGVRTLRQTMQQAMGKNYENPNVRKMTLREALQGYGTGLEKVMSGAGREARSEHQQELNLQREAEMANFKQQTQAAMQTYQNAWSDYLKGEETVSTTTPGVSGTEGTSGGGVKMGNKTYYQTRNPFTGRPQPI